MIKSSAHNLLVYGLLVFVALGAGVGCFTPDPILPPPPSLNSGSASERGQELAKGFGACGFCHSMDGSPSSPLAGGRTMRDMYGDIQAPNITLAHAGIGDWSEADFKNALRANIRPDGSIIASQAHKGFEWIADSDIAAITVYLRSLPQSEQKIERRDVSSIERNTIGFFDTRLEVKGYIPAINPSFKAEFGQYLVDSVARCGSCHSKPDSLLTSEEYLAGGQEITFDGDQRVAPNITSSKSAGIGGWSESDIKRFLLSGRTPEGREVDSRFCPVRFYAQAPEEHINSVVAYLRSVPAID